MPFELKHSSENRILQSHTHSAKDFHWQEFQSSQLEESYPFGILKMQQWCCEGIRMIYSDWLLSEDNSLDWKGDLELVVLYFNLKGNTTITAKGLTSPFQFTSNQHNMFFGNEAEGKMKGKDRQIQSFLIQFTKDTFMRIASDGNDSLKRFADNVWKGKSISLGETNLPMNLGIQSCIQSILTCTFADSLKKIFLISKAMEMLVWQAESYQATLHSKKTSLKTSYDQERIVFARDYLVQHMDTPPSLLELAKISGINEFKLKKGFKEVFGTTVFTYLAEYRLELAKTALLEQTKQVKDIAFELGYSSIGHFSNAFKKKFGVPPTQFH